MCMGVSVCVCRSEMSDPTLNAITGFHVSDGEIHIVVLEGLKDQGMQTLWEEVPHHSLQGLMDHTHPLNRACRSSVHHAHNKAVRVSTCSLHTLSDEGVITVLWNSAYQFSERLYGPLDVDIPCIRLHQPLRLLTQQSAVYIIDNVPEQSFKALMCLNEVRSSIHPYYTIL